MTGWGWEWWVREETEQMEAQINTRNSLDKDTVQRGHGDFEHWLSWTEVLSGYFLVGSWVWELLSSALPTLRVCFYRVDSNPCSVTVHGLVRFVLFILKAWSIDILWVLPGSAQGCWLEGPYSGINAFVFQSGRKWFGCISKLRMLHLLFASCDYIVVSCRVV